MSHDPIRKGDRDTEAAARRRREEQRIAGLAAIPVQDNHVPRVYGIWDPDAIGADAVKRLREALSGGLRDVQLRLRDRLSYMLAVEAARAVESVGGRIWINRDLGLAHQLDAVGIQTGEGGPTAMQVRKSLPGNRFIGYSYHLGGTLTENVALLSMVVLSPIFETRSKPGASPIGLDAIGQVRQKYGLPVVALGGITAKNARDCIRAGASGVGAIRSIFLAHDPKKAAADLLAATVLD